MSEAENVLNGKRVIIILEVKNLLEILQFVLMGLLGAACFVLLKAEGWADLKKFKMIRRLIIGVVVGYLYSLLYSDYSFPNFIMSFVAGYAGTDFIEAIVIKFRKED